jgi:flagellar hook assembly protein FlgD
VWWDGRGDDGTILENGTYTVAVTAKDASWNEGAPCLANVTIDNLLAPVGE